MPIRRDAQPPSRRRRTIPRACRRRCCAASSPTTPTPTSAGDHRFAAIRALDDFRRQLPVAGYEYFEPTSPGSAGARPARC